MSTKKPTRIESIFNAGPRPGQETDSTAQIAKAAGLNLSPVRSTEIGKLKENPVSSKHFRDLSGDDFAKLKEDIKARGVLVPLVAMKDGTLLAGHNRLRAAREIGVEKVPVQWVEDELSRKDQEGFVIKDNVLRRQLSAQEKESLILSLYGEKIAESKHGGDRGNQFTGGKVKSNLAKQVEAETGIKEATAKKIIAKHKKAIAQKKTPTAEPLKALLAQLDKLKAEVQTLTLRLDAKKKEVSDLQKLIRQRQK